MEICPSPTAPPNGEFEPNNQTTWMPGDIVRYVCDMGYVLEGSDNQVCGENGTFNGTAPECVGTCASIIIRFFVNAR